MLAITQRCDGEWLKMSSNCNHNSCNSTAINHKISFFNLLWNLWPCSQKDGNALALPGKVAATYTHTHTHTRDIYVWQTPGKWGISKPFSRTTAPSIAAVNFIHYLWFTSKTHQCCCIEGQMAVVTGNPATCNLPPATCSPLAKPIPPKCTLLINKRTKMLFCMRRVQLGLSRGVP